MLTSSSLTPGLETVQLSPLLSSDQVRILWPQRGCAPEDISVEELETTEKGLDEEQSSREVFCLDSLWLSGGKVTETTAAPLCSDLAASMHCKQPQQTCENAHSWVQSVLL